MPTPAINNTHGVRFGPMDADSTSRKQIDSAPPETTPRTLLLTTPANEKNCAAIEAREWRHPGFLGQQRIVAQNRQCSSGAPRPSSAAPRRSRRIRPPTSNALFEMAERGRISIDAEVRSELGRPRNRARRSRNQKALLSAKNAAGAHLTITARRRAAPDATIGPT